MTDEKREVVEEFGKGAKGIHRRWMLELTLANKREEDWRKIAKETIDIYRGTKRKKNSFNILWSNTETLMPAVYNSLPQPNVRRRFKDADPVGKAVSEVISRSLEFSIDSEQFDVSIKRTLLDMLLPGRGISRVKYVPDLKPVIYEDVEDSALDSETTEELDWEQVVIEHVQYDDFRMGAGKTWDEVEWIAFHHRMCREDLIEKFGEAGRKLTLDDTGDDDLRKEDEDVAEVFKTASVWEIWDKEAKEIIFVTKNNDEPLKIMKDEMELSGFFPTPRPLYAIIDSNTLIPTTLYSQYQEQAEELNTISTRINKLLSALRVRGVYDSTFKGIEDLLKSQDNTLIPAADAAVWIERGGLEKAIWMMPIEQAAQVIVILMQQREACKQVIYEINGLGDILRGQTNANETLGAQQIKAQWGTMRISTLQRELQRYIRDTLRIMSEVICSKFQLDTLQKMTGLQYPTNEQVMMMQQQYEQAVTQYQIAMQSGQQVPPPQPPQKPPYTWESLHEVMKDDKQRTYKIDVETDSTVAATIQEDVKGLTELLSGVVQFINGVAPAVQMGALPIEAAKEIVMSVCRRSKMGTAVEDALEQMQSPQQQQDPNAAVNAAAQQVEQARTQLEVQKHQDGMQLEQIKLQQSAAAEERKANAAYQMEQLKLDASARDSELQKQASIEIERHKAELKAQSDIAIKQLEAENELRRIEKEQEFERWKLEFTEANKMTIACMSNEGKKEQEETNEPEEIGEDMEQQPDKVEQLINSVNENIMHLMNAHHNKHTELMMAVTRPKEVIRDENGRIKGVK